MEEKDLIVEFGQIVRQTRRYVGLNQRQLAQQVNTSLRTVLYVEKGIRTHINTRRRLAHWLSKQSIPLSEQLSNLKEKFASIL